MKWIPRFSLLHFIAFGAGTSRHQKVMEQSPFRRPNDQALTSLESPAIVSKQRVQIVPPFFGNANPSFVTVTGADALHDQFYEGLSPPCRENV